QAVGNYAPADLSLSSNQRSVANMLNALPFVTSGDLFEVLNAINALTTDQAVSRSFDEISPQKYAALPTLAFPVTHMQFQYLRNRLARQRWEAELGSDAVSSGGGGFMRGFNFGYDNRMLLAASNLTLSDAGNPLIRKGVDHRWGIYLEPMANWGNLSPTANMVGYRYKNFGFTLGADYWVTDNLLVGVNTGYSKTLTGVGGTGGDINANIIPFNAYSAFFVKGFYVNGTLGYTFSNYDMERNVAFGTINRTAKANTSGNQFQAAGETGYDFKVGNAIVGPTVSLQYATQTTGGFTESNAGALNLKVASQTADSLQTGIGARVSYRAKVGNVTVKPQLAVVWQHEFSNNTRGVDARLAQGSSTMNWRTDKIGQDFAVVSFALPARVSKNLVAHVGYTAEVGRSKSSNQGINLGLRYEF
ncbi:MAG: autotransporter outer membrane beta-barrel domain-containing protein, partial [Proteobacteria bacterium]|nr:autotransporter outer membrane beta-barrel domain-containing protein [Pseudomonadota bacterium]